MPQEQDFDFKTKLGHYRGKGTRGLVALAIVHLPRAALFGAGAYAAAPTLQWLVQVSRTVGF